MFISLMFTFHLPNFERLISFKCTAWRIITDLFCILISILKNRQSWKNVRTTKSLPFCSVKFERNIQMTLNTFSFIESGLFRVCNSFEL